MTPVTRFGLLAAACIASVSAHGHGHAHGHQHAHLHKDVKEAATVTSSASASQTSLPACWETCFGKYHASETALCGSGVGVSVKSCIDTACKNSPGAAKAYASWLQNYCPNSATGSGTGTGTGYPRPTGYTHYTTVCPLTEYTSTATWTSGALTSYSTWVVTSTLSGYPGAYTPPVQSAPQVSPTSSECPADTTVTVQATETVTVTAGAGGNYWTGAAGGSWPSASPAGYTPSAQSPSAYSPPAQSPSAYSPPAQSSAQSSPSAYTAPAQSPTASPSQASPSSSWSSSAPSSSPSGGSSPTTSTGYSKRGLAYNVAADTNAFLGHDITWAYNWGSLPEGLPSGINFIPMLWSNGAQFTGWWADNVPTVLSEGASWFFSFNEPDMPSQANMSPQEAADAWMTYMEPYAGKVKLVAPAVTNGVGSGLGLSWLTEFMSLCSSCTISAVNQHWYDSTANDVEYFQQQITQIHQTTGLPVFVSEWAGIGSDDEIISFMTTIEQWMDQQDFIIGYSYYMVGDGYLNDGTGLSPLGQAYVDA